ISLILAACGTNDDNDSSASNSSNNEADQETAEENEEQESANQAEEDENNNAEHNEEEKEPAYETNENWYLKPLGEQDVEVAVITIDDAPDDHAVEMAHTLDDLDVPAIFFVNGHFIDDKEGAEKLNEIDELGFPIGNHTMTHPDRTPISEEEQEE